MIKACHFKDKLYSTMTKTNKWDDKGPSQMTWSQTIHKAKVLSLERAYHSDVTRA